MAPNPDLCAPAAAWRDVSIRHVGGGAVGPASISVAPGERVALLGPSGCGKSSLLLALTGLGAEERQAEIGGERRVFGADAATRTAAEWADGVAHLFQSPEANLVGLTVGEELAFAPEQLGLSEAEIRARVEGSLQAVGAPAEWAARRVAPMSGGERQRVAIAPSLAQAPRLWLVDEPTAHLDAEAAGRLRALLSAQRQDRAEDRTIVIVDHRLDGVIDRIDRVVALDDQGRVFADGPPRVVFREMSARRVQTGLWRPAAMRLDAELRASGISLDPAPLTIAEAVAGLDQLAPPLAAIAREVVVRTIASERPVRSGEFGAVVARLADADCVTPSGTVAVRNANVTLAEGEILAVVGPNGAGKSTLGYALAGLTRLKAGRREGPPGGVLFQAPDLQFMAADVSGEIALALDGGRRGRGMDAARPADISARLAAWGLAGLERRHPLDLSEGQKRRLALATLEASPWGGALVLDEPTAGLDPRAAAALEQRVRVLAAGETGAQRGVALITHDMDLVYRLADRVIALEAGRVVFEGTPAALFGESGRRRALGLAEPTALELARWLEQTPA